MFLYLTLWLKADLNKQFVLNYYIYNTINGNILIHSAQKNVFNSSKTGLYFLQL